MEILCFKISGKFAHFRKYYANNTAFSFTIPPRTSLMGMVAAALGLERDSYYERFASENIRFGIRVLSPLKKSFHRLNLLSIKSLGDMSKKFSSDFRGEGGRIQTPFEVVTGLNISKDEVTYQVFITANKNGITEFEAIKNSFLEKNPVFNITLGTANFSASISDIQCIVGEEISGESLDDYILLHSAVPSEHIAELKFSKDCFDSYNFVEEDMMPGDFVANKNREVRKMNRVVFSTTPNPLRVKLTKPIFRITLNNEPLNIQFMDA
jgi:CRISPR-associated protein Cas5h